MKMRKALLLGNQANLKSIGGMLASQSFEVTPPAKHYLVRKVGPSEWDLVLVDLDEIPTSSGEEIVEQLLGRGEPVVIIGGARYVYGKQLEPLLARPRVDWVETPFRHRKRFKCELQWRIQKAVGKFTSVPASTLGTSGMPELRSDDSGRLDAALVAKHFGWSLSALARALRRSVQAVHKTPDAPALQKKLEPLERTALLARRLVSDKPSEFRKWLNTPSRDLDDEKPGKLLLEKPAVVVQWLEDAALGHPA